MDIECAYTAEQFRRLTEAQKAALAATAKYLSRDSPALESLDDEELDDVFNLLQPCPGCVPEEEIDDELLRVIRRKFAAVYWTAVELASEELTRRGLKSDHDFNLCLIIDPDYDDFTIITVVDPDKSVCYLYEGHEARHFGFGTLARLAEAVLGIQRLLVERVAQGLLPSTPPRRVYVSVEGGLVQDVTGVPAGVQVVVLDYDIEGAAVDELGTSPLDSRPCCLSVYAPTEPVVPTH
jgi:hypothetical protein